MPHYNEFKKGLYLCHRRANKYGVIKHFGIIDIGNVLGNQKSMGTHPLVYHKNGSGPLVQAFVQTDVWIVKDVVSNLKGAKQRLIEVMQNKNYNLIFDNCEHFANYIAYGRRESGQVNSAIVISGLLVGAYLIASNDARASEPIIGKGKLRSSKGKKIVRKKQNG